VSTNLLAGSLLDVDSSELRLLIDRRIGGPGQYHQRDQFPNNLLVPLGGSQCQIILAFEKERIVSIEPGPAFDSAQWVAFVTSAEESLLSGATKVGREYSFSGFRVTGSWRGERSGVQLCPSPVDAPRAEVEMAAHPFILEFPIKTSDTWEITNQRRIREHRRLTLLLNVLLRGRLSLEPRQTEHFWALDDSNGGEWHSRWTQRGFFAKLHGVVLDQWSPLAAEELVELEPEVYYGLQGNDGKGLRVPRGLDESICVYKELDRNRQSKFDRAAFWFDLASSQWTLSMSASFASLVSAIESLTERGNRHSYKCPVCQEGTHHEVPGATGRVRDFREAYAPGSTYAKQRHAMYGLRSAILHGSELIHFDEGRHFGWDPPWWNQYELQSELWTVTRTALRNWLLAA
jgi:hypothetical protein